jgi:hypothetical protein
MKAYSYDGNGFFQGEVERQFDDLDKRWLMPASATDKKPPEEEGKIAVWNGEDWGLKDDNRGIYYNTETTSEVIVNNPLEDISKLTKLKPEGIVKWNDSAWIEDTETINKIEAIKIKSQLAEIDIKRIRPLAEIGNKKISDKTYAENKLDELEVQATALRLELKKYE